MAYPREARSRARERFVSDGWSLRRISTELGVGKTTLVRWARTEGWEELRDQQDAIELESRKLLLRMLDVAQQEGDAQLTYAAVQAAKLAGITLGAESTGPSPKECAVILLDVLGKHPEIGPAVRGHRNEVVRLFLQEVDRLESKSGTSAAS